MSGRTNVLDPFKVILQGFCQELLEVLFEVPLEVPHKVLRKGLPYVLLKMILKTFQLEWGHFQSGPGSKL